MARFTYTVPTSTDELKKVYEEFREFIGTERTALDAAIKKFIHDWTNFHGVMFLQDDGLKTKLRSEKIDEKIADYQAMAKFYAQRDWDSFIAEGPSRPFETYVDGLRYFIDCADEYLTAANKTKANMGKYAA